MVEMVDIEHPDVKFLEGLLFAKFGFLGEGDIWFSPKGTIEMYVPAGQAFPVELAILDAIRGGRPILHPVTITEYDQEDEAR